MNAAGFFSLTTSKCPPGSSTTPSPRDPFGSDHARAILLRPSTARSIDATTFNALGSMSSTRGGVSGAAKRARGRQHRQPRSGRHAWEALNLRVSQCCAYASRFDPHRCAAGKTRRSSLLGRRPRSETSDRFGCGANKCQRLREVARLPRGALAAGSCSTYRFPQERVSADLKEVQSPVISRVFCPKSIRVAMSALGQKRTSEHVQSLPLYPQKRTLE